MSDELGMAEREFLVASVAVWREIDRLDSRPEGYHPTAMDIELRQRERAAWIRYRDLRDRAWGEPDLGRPCPTCSAPAGEDCRSFGYCAARSADG